MLNSKRLNNWILAAATAVAMNFTHFTTPAIAQSVPAGGVLIVYDSAGAYGWIGAMHAKMLANLMGHFDLPYKLESLESYQAGDMTPARATFYFGLTYDNPLPDAFTNDVMNATNTVCWFKYNLWRMSWPNPSFNTKFGFGFNWLDASGYSNIVYKGETFTKNQLDPELGYISIFNTNLVTTPIIAVKTNADGTTASIPYATHSGNFWYISDSPFDYMSEEDRYLAFADLLHDILGIDHPVSHRALIRLEDVATVLYTPQNITQSADTLKALNVPFSMALIPVYTDPLGTYTGGVPETHRLSDAADTVSKNFLTAIRYAVARGGQIITEGYTHQYSNQPNPYDGVSGDDFEFWRETFNTNDPANPYALGLYQPVTEDSAAWAYSRVLGAKTEVAQAGLASVGFFSPHYVASATDYQVFATNFSLTMERSVYFADDYNPTNNHLAGQFFPYQVNKDLYGRTVIGENIGGYEPTPWLNYPARTPADLIRTAKKNLVVRDGWANAFFHGFYPLTNLQQIVTGIKALGYTYVPLSTNSAPSITTQPASRTNNAGTTATFSVAAAGALPMTYAWFFNGAAIANATNASLSIGNVQSANAGNYAVIVANSFGSATSTVATLTVLAAAPTITAQPASRTNSAGTTASFTVRATGTAPLAYQWLFNGVAIANATNASLSVANVQSANAGGYSVIVSNPLGSLTSAAATLTVLAAAPTITTQPQNRNAAIGASVTFSVAAIGTQPFTYQWRYNGVNILGANASTYTIASASAAYAGVYSVVIANAVGSATSANATLTVGTAPFIVAQPASQIVLRGSTVNLSVVAGGSAPLAYQWSVGGVSIANATNATYTLTNVQTNNAGSYRVLVSNPFGSVNSARATLTVN